MAYPEFTSADPAERLAWVRLKIQEIGDSAQSYTVRGRSAIKARIDYLDAMETKLQAIVDQSISGKVSVGVLLPPGPL